MSRDTGSPGTQISVGTPEAGWLDVFVCVGGRELRIDASDAVVDSLTEFAELGLFAASEQLGEKTCTFFLEPGATHLRIGKSNGEATIAIFDTPGLHMPRAGDRPSLVAGVESQDFALALWRGLREAESRWSDVPETAWSWPFPESKVAQLGQQLGR